MMLFYLHMLKCYRVAGREKKFLTFESTKKLDLSFISALCGHKLDDYLKSFE